MIERKKYILAKGRRHLWRGKKIEKKSKGEVVEIFTYMRKKIRRKGNGRKRK